MKIVDMSHTMSVHTPGWVGYSSNQMYYAQNIQTVHINAQRVDTALHVGTHIDGALHGSDVPNGDMASYPLEFMVGKGAIIDISDKVGDWDVITPEMVEAAGVPIEEDDILILHTGYHKYYQGQPKQDLERYFCFAPGGGMDLLYWMFEKKIRWWGVDIGTADHPMNTTIRNMRPDLAKRFEEHRGKPMSEIFPDYEYTHKPSGRLVRSNVFPFHNLAFQEGLTHAENLGGDIETVLNQRAIIGAFPWKYEGLEACPCRIVAFLDCGEMNVEQLGAAFGGK